MLLQPLMLAWIAGAAVPLVLHLLSRSTYRAVPWGAMMFLTGIDTGAHRSAQLKQWSLLLLRMALVGLLAVALARPVISSRYAWVPTAGLTTGGPAAVVIILDDSASMGYEANGKTRLNEARQVTLQILSSLKRGDEAALLLAGSHEYQPPFPPSADLQSIASRMADLRPDTGAPDFAAELIRAADLLEHNSSTEHEIYLICDRQALGWRNLTAAFKQRWNSHGGPAPKLVVIPVGADESDNIAVDAVEIPDHSAIRNQSTLARLHVHNYGPEPVTSVPVSLWTGRRTLAETTLDMPAHAARTLSVPIRFPDAGPRVLSVAVHSTGLTTDDRLDYAVDVFEEPRVLVIDGDDATAASRPVDNLASPSTQPDLAATEKLKTISIHEFSPDLLKQYNQIILNDSAQFSPDQINELKIFVRTGGNVLLLPGDSATAEQYNNGLCADNGLFFARFNPPGPNAKPVHLGNFDHQHPIFRFLSDRAIQLTKTPIARFFPVAVHSSEIHILARFNNAQPFLLESTAARGHVLLLTTPLDSNTPGDAELLQSIIRYFGIGAAADRNLRPGQPIIAVTPDPVEDNSATVQLLAGGPREPAALNRLPDRTEIRFNKTSTPGIYRLRYRTLSKEKVLNYVVTASRSDSDLTPLTDQQWKTLSGRVRFNRVDLSRTTVAAAMEIQRGSREIWIELIAGVLLLMTLEMILSRWWSMG